MQQFSWGTDTCLSPKADLDKPQGCVWTSEVLSTQTGPVKDLPVQYSAVAAGLIYACSLPCGRNPCKGQEWNRDEIWFSFNSCPANSPWSLCEEAEESASPLVLWKAVRALCNLLVTGAFCALVWCNHQRFFVSPPTCHSPTPFCHVSWAYTVFLSSLRRYCSELSDNTVPF